MNSHTGPRCLRGVRRRVRRKRRSLENIGLTENSRELQNLPDHSDIATTQNNEIEIEIAGDMP